jgi:CDP-glucose 4,6-dehydratase
MTSGSDTAQPLMADQLCSFYQGRRVLVTGSTGFKGSWLCRLLLHLGAEVYGYALEPPTTPSLWSIAGIEQDVRQTTADIRDLSALNQAFLAARPQAVLHLAAQPLVIESYSRPRYTYETNVMGTVNVLEAVRACDSVTSFLNVTTDKVYENIEQPGYGYHEDDKLDGFDPYSNSKSCSELVTHSYAKSFFAAGAQGEAAGRCAISTARAGNVIGGGDFSDNRIIPDCVRAAQSGAPVVIRNPNSVRPYQHVLEPLVAYLRIVAGQELDGSLAGWYNIGPDDKDAVTTGELVRLFARSWGEGFSYEEGHVDGPHEANYLKLDNAKAKRMLGWQPVWDVSEAVSRTVEWTKAWLEGGQSGASACMDKQIDDYMGALS